MKNTNEQILSSFKNELATQMGSAGVLSKDGGTQAFLDFKSEIPEDSNIIRKPKKKGISSNLVGKTKMNLPIGKLYSMGTNVGAKVESNEATGSGGSGQYSQPLFSTTKKEVEEKWSKKYKDSIDCNNPKGFSQRAHCQGKKKKQVSEEKLKGGKSDNKTFQDLVNKNKRKGKDITVVEKELKIQLQKGMKVEMEHTKDKEKAKEIAMDHLFEDPKYYDKLQKIETKEKFNRDGKSEKSLDDMVKKYKKIKDEWAKIKKDVKKTEKKDDSDVKKTETKEATGASSSGQYSTPAAWAKSTSKKDWRGRSKTQIPGGKFVQVKKKCKKFPYCNQGDIKALNIFDHVEVKKVIKDVSESYGVSEQVIKNIIAYEYSQYKSNK